MCDVTLFFSRYYPRRVHNTRQRLLQLMTQDAILSIVYAEEMYRKGELLYSLREKSQSLHREHTHKKNVVARKKEVENLKGFLNGMRFIFSFILFGVCTQN
jgi:hypothetical protein